MNCSFGLRVAGDGASAPAANALSIATAEAAIHASFAIRRLSPSVLCADPRMSNIGENRVCDCRPAQAQISAETATSAAFPCRPPQPRQAQRLDDQEEHDQGAEYHQFQVRNQRGRQVQAQPRRELVAATAAAA